MAAPTDGIKISAMTDGVTANATDDIPANRAGSDVRITPAYIKTYIGAQPLDATLTALASFNTNGLLAQTAADTFVGRTLAGTSNRLTVTNGDGVAGAPTFDISASYAGQASITTLGTVGTGVWQGTAVAPGFGGTGLATYAIGDLLYADGAASLAKLADVATGNALISGGVTTAPSWGKVGLTTHVSGILPSANGGTGVNNAGTLTNATNTTITGGGTLALGGFTLTVPATGSAALLGTANVFTTIQEIDRDGIGAVSTSALALVNNTAAAAGAQQWSPRLRLTGQGWKTNATAASQTVDWTIENVPVQGTANPTTALIISSQVNGAGYIEQLRVGSLSASIGGAPGTGLTIDKSSTVWRMTAPSGTALTLSADSIETLRIDTAANVGIGTTAATSKLHVRLNNATTAAVDTVFTLTHSTTNGGGGAAGFGLGQLIQLESDTTEFTSAADDLTEWVVPTHASRTVKRTRRVYDTAARTTIIEQASGSAPMIGFLGAAAVVRQTGGENLTNNVTSGGTDGTITNWTDLTTYATDAAAIRNAIYQLARALKQDHDALRLYGFLT